MINVRLIDADALIKRLEDTSRMPVPAWLRMEIVNAPTIEPKKGKWKDSVLGMDGYYANCSECGYQIDVHKARGYPNYCEHCGADMRGDDK